MPFRFFKRYHTLFVPLGIATSAKSEYPQLVKDVAIIGDCGFSEHGDIRHDAPGQIDEDEILPPYPLTLEPTIDAAGELVSLGVGYPLRVFLVVEERGGGRLGRVLMYAVKDVIHAGKVLPSGFFPELHSLPVIKRGFYYMIIPQGSRKV